MRRGAAVLCPDNLGQGEREPMGHTDCVKPFACGTSVQGLIVAETLGWIAWAREQARFDRQRLAAIGNSRAMPRLLAKFRPRSASREPTATSSAPSTCLKSSTKTLAIEPVPATPQRMVL